MAAFTQWLAGVLSEGHSTQTVAPELTVAERPAVESLLRDAYATLRREVAGPPIPFDLELAVRIARLLADACWHLSALPPETPLPSHALTPPASASEHLTGDLLLRFLVSVRKRASLRGPADPLAIWCESFLRAWPLSGVSMHCRDGPTTALAFDGHPGLAMLYAERLAAHPEPAWVPPSGAVSDFVERAFAELGRVIPVLPESVA
jgi:hypothetical protein